MGFKRKLLKVVLVLMLIAVLPGLPPRTVFPFRPIAIGQMRTLSGVLAPNQLLNGAERLHENVVLQPECVLVRGNATYVTVYGGEVLELIDGTVRTVVKLGPECVGTYSERLCGRPLGMDFDTKSNALIVLDPYLGIWQVHIKTGESKLLVSMENALIEDGTARKAVDERRKAAVASRKPKIPNGVAVARNGDFYWTDTASDFSFEDAVPALLCNPSGRLLHYSRAEGKSRVLLDEVYGANGVVLSPDESFVLVGELGGQLIRRYFLKGAQAGTHDVFLDGLPGSVDNLNGDANGFWVALVIAADESNPSFVAMLAPFPNLRQLIVRMFVLVEAPFRFLYKLTGSLWALWASHHIGNLGGLVGLFPDRGTVLRVDWEGNIVFALHNDDTSSHVISQAVPQGKEHLLLGSPVNPWLGRVKLSPETLALLKGQTNRSPESKQPSSPTAPPAREEL